MPSTENTEAATDTEEDERYQWQVLRRWKVVRILFLLVITLFLAYVNYVKPDLLSAIIPPYYRIRLMSPQPKTELPIPIVRLPTQAILHSSPSPEPSVTLTPFKLGHTLLFTNGPALYETDGETEHKLTTFPDTVLSILPSPDGKKMAVTYKSQSQSTGLFDYFNSKLVIYEPDTGSLTQVMTADNTSVTYPRWSPDGRYLSFWTGGGRESFVWDILGGNPVFSVKGSPEHPAGPVVFSGDGRHILYISDDTLFSSLPDGSDSRVLSANAGATRPVHEGPSLPNLPVTSPDGSSVFYYATSGAFMAMNLDKGTEATVAAGTDKGMFSGYPTAYPVGFVNDTELLFYAYDSTGNYKYGSKAPLFLFDTSDMKRRDFGFTEGMLSKGGADLNSTFVAPDRSSVVVHSVYSGHGFDLYDPSGVLMKSCDDTDFTYSYYNWGGGTNYPSNLTVWSPDGKLIVSEPNGTSLKVIEPRSCTVFTISKTPFTLAVWSL